MPKKNYLHKMLKIFIIYLFTGIPDAIATAVLGGMNLSALFTELDGHMIDSSVEENHIHILIKIAKSFGFYSLITQRL